MEWCMKDQRVRPGGLNTPTPTPTHQHAQIHPHTLTQCKSLRIGWAWQGWGWGWGWGRHKGQLFSGAPSVPVCPRGHLAPLNGIRWELKAPINKQDGSGIVFPPSFHKPLSVWVCEFSVAVGSLVLWCCRACFLCLARSVTHDLRDPEMNLPHYQLHLVWLWNLNGALQAWFIFRP